MLPKNHKLSTKFSGIPLETALNHTHFPESPQPDSPHEYGDIGSQTKSWKTYLLLWLMTNAITWSSALLYQKVKSPTYASKWTIAVPGVHSSADIELPGIGRASSQTQSAYLRDFADPRESYKFLAQTDEVRETAADQLAVESKKFGKPQVKILDNTTLMEFELKGDNPQQAQNKAHALHNALEDKLEEIRQREATQQDTKLQRILESSRQQLIEAQKRLSNYRVNSGLTSQDQLRDLSGSIEDLRRERAQTIAQLQQVNARFQDLSTSLGVSAPQAASALVLNSDELFQKYLDDYTTASAQLAVSTSKFSSQHPEVRAKQAQVETMQGKLLSRGQLLLGQPLDSATLALPNLGNSRSSTSESNLFQEVIDLQAQQRGLDSKAQALGQQVAQLENRLTLLSQHGSKLASLQRDVQIAEAVFSSTLTKIDLSKSNTSSSYPQILLFTQPSLPKQPSTPKSKLVLLGAAAGSLFWTMGIVSLWLRDRRSATSGQSREQIAPIYQPHLQS